jgi:hypothetical protein
MVTVRRKNAQVSSKSGRLIAQWLHTRPQEISHISRITFPHRSSAHKSSQSRSEAKCCPTDSNTSDRSPHLSSGTLPSHNTHYADTTTSFGLIPCPPEKQGQTTEEQTVAQIFDFVVGCQSVSNRRQCADCINLLIFRTSAASRPSSSRHALSLSSNLPAPTAAVSSMTCPS